MKHATIFAAYPVIAYLKQYRFDGLTALRLSKLEKELKEVYDFQTEEQQKLIAEYHPEYDKKTNQLKFKDAQTCDAFVKAANELDNLEHEMKSPLIRIPIEKVLELSADEMDRVSDLIEFYDEEPQIEVKEVNPEDIPADAEEIKLTPVKND